MWALALQSLGAALRLLAPAALLTIFCGQDSLIIRLLQHCDRAVRGVLFPTPDQTDGILQWLQTSLPGDKRTKSLDTVWADGSVLCDLVESVVPGSCQGHPREERVDLTHGQRLAEQYLGVTPIFSERELSQKVLITYQEYRLTHYLSCIKDAVGRLSLPVSRTGIPVLNVQAYTLDYVARGMGLVTASRNRRSTFYLYPTAQQGLDPADISVQIKGPGNCYGTTIVPVIYGRTHIIRNVFLNLGQHSNYMHLPLPMTQGSSYLRTCNKTEIEKNYSVPKIKNDIEVNILVRHDRVKINYIPLIAGRHELSLISKGCHIIGSPFTIDVDVGSKERQNSVDYLDEDVVIENQNKPERRVVFRIVDFVTEKMLLTEDGKLEKISDNEAEKLLHTAESLDDMTLKYLQYTNRTLPGPDLIEYNNNMHSECSQQSNELEIKKTFNLLAREIIIMLRVCKEFKKVKNVLEDKSYTYPENNICQKKLTVTPDVVNSTINESPFNNFNTSCEVKLSEETKSSVGGLRDLFKKKVSSFNLTIDEENEADITSENKDTNFKISDTNKENCKNNYNSENDIDDVSYNTKQKVNQFKKKVPSFNLTVDEESDTKITSENTNANYRTSISNEENPKSHYDSENDSDDVSYTGKRRIYSQMASIEIIISSIDDDDADLMNDSGPPTILPMLEEELPERPKTPVYKILATKNSQDDNSVYNEFEHYKLENQIFDSLGKHEDIYCPKMDLASNANLFANKAVEDRCISPSIDFHIGAPVTPTRMMNPTSSDLDMDSIILAENLEEALNKFDMKLQKNMNDNDFYISDDGNSMFTTPNPQTPFEQMTDSQILRMYEDKILLKDDKNSTKTQSVCEFDEFDRDKISLENLKDQKCDMDDSQDCQSSLMPTVQNLESFSSYLQNDDQFLLNETSRQNSAETWDSAYISIDEINSSPDTNSNSPRSDSSPRGKLCPIVENENESPAFNKCRYKRLTEEEFDKMGPAEKEIWRNIEHEKAKSHKFDLCLNTSKTLLKPSNKKGNHSQKVIETVNEDENVLLKTTEIVSSENNKTFFFKTGELLSTNGLIVSNHKSNNDARFEKISLNNSCDQLFLKKDSWKHHKPRNILVNLLDNEKKLKTKTCDGSASDFNADVKRSKENDKQTECSPNDKTGNEILMVEYIADQKYINDGNSMNCFKKENTDTLSKQLESYISPAHQNKRDDKSNVNVLSKIVSEKKEYRVEAIEKTYRSPHKRTALKRNDSLSRKRAKQTIVKIPSISQKWKHSFEPKVQKKNENLEVLPCSGSNSLVARWKNYWNDKVEISQSPENDIKTLQRHNTNNFLKNMEIENLSGSRKKKHGLNNVSEPLKEINISCNSTILDKDKDLNSHFSRCFENKQIQSDFEILKYNPKPINLDALSERVQKFVDSSPNSTPEIDYEESQFSTPNRQKNIKNLAVIDKNDNRLTLNSNLTERKFEVLHDIGNALAPEIQVFVTDPVIENKNYYKSGELEKEKLVSNENKDNIDVSEYTTPEPYERMLNKDDFKDFPTISEIKAKIQNNENIAKIFARESFLKKSQTIDIPKTHSIEKLKRFFSLELLDKSIDNNNFYRPLPQNKVLSKGQSLKNINCDDSDKRSTFLNEKSISIESFPTLSERRARIEKHLQSVQKRINQNQAEVTHSELDKNYTPMKLDKFESQVTPDREFEASGEEKIPSYSVEKYIYEKEIRTVKKNKLVGAIVATFENWGIQSFQNDETQETSPKRKKLHKIETTQETRKNKRNAESQKLEDIDAENGEGTRMNRINSINSEAMQREIKKNNVEDIKTSYKKILVEEMTNNSQTGLFDKKNCQSDVKEYTKESVNSVDQNKEQEELINYKERFRKAKFFFQTIDAINTSSIESNSALMNECEKMLLGINDMKEENIANREHEAVTINETKTMNEFLNRACQNGQRYNERPFRRHLRKYPIKSFSAPTSDTERDFHNFERRHGGSCRLKKISEKFLVDGLFQDIAGASNKTSVGIFKGIPHKSAVLAAFRSMDSISQTTSYEYTISQMEDFAKKNGIVNAQTYHSEYPHLPTTAPGKYRARQDFVASGLIPRKDLLNVNKPRRNSAPDTCRMKLSFITHI